uniref:Uncharacterized protein n=1 Tax=Anguilla anguilla TaxID=7936 RepID=A0A0E9PYM8_ANGAN
MKVNCNPMYDMLLATATSVAGSFRGRSARSPLYSLLIWTLYCTIIRQM